MAEPEDDRAGAPAGAGVLGARRAEAAARHRREREIAEVLGRHGLALLAGTLGLERAVSLERRIVRRDAEALAAPAQQLRLAMEELGPTFIKLGQLLSTRADLLPTAYRLELSRLQDAAPPSPADAIRETLESELTGGIDGAFASFDAEPLAAGSVGQAHAAVLHDGTAVVVKVRKPGVVEQVEQDLEIVQNLAARASRRSATAEALDVIGIAQEFAGELRDQLDYIREACNAERFAANFADVPNVRIPKVYWDSTTSRVITLERLEGMKVTDAAALDAAGIDRQALARDAATAIGKMVFDDGFFHGDPHPGNFFVGEGGRLGIIDFGIVGTLGDEERARVRAVLIALDRGDPDRLAAALIAMRASRGPVDRVALRDDLAGIVDTYVGRGVSTIPLGGLIRELLDVFRRHRLRVPRDLSLLLRTILLEESIVEQLDPDFRMIEALEPYARGDFLAQLSPSLIAQRLRETGVDLAELAVDLPGQLHRVLGVLADGPIEVHLRAADLEPLMDRAERLGNRIAASVLAAAVLDAGVQLATRGDDRRGRRRRPIVSRRLAAAGLAAYAARRRRSPSRHART